MTVRADVAVRLPDGFADLEAAPLLCGGVIGYRALRVAGVVPGCRLGLFGFGASALLAIQVARHWGCEVYVFTRSEPERERARALGAAWAGGYDDRGAGRRSTRRSRSRRPARSSSPRCGPSTAAAPWRSTRSTSIGSRRCPTSCLWWERSLRSVANVTREDARAFLALAAEIPIRTAIEVHPLAEGGLALERLAAGEVAGSAVLAID